MSHWPPCACGDQFTLSEVQLGSHTTKVKGNHNIGNELHPVQQILLRWRHQGAVLQEERHPHSPRRSRSAGERRCGKIHPMEFIGVKVVRRVDKETADPCPRDHRFYFHM